MYFKNKFKDGFLNLYGTKVVLLVASGFLGLFVPLFLFELFDNDIRWVVAFFGISSLLYVVTIPLGAMFLNRFGFKKALRVSLVFGALWYVILYFMDKGNYFYLAPLSIFVLVLFRISHWIPYIVDFAKFSDGGDRAKQLSAFDITRNILSGLLPIASGFIILKYGFDAVFIIGIVLYILAGLFLIKIPKTEEKFDWNYKQSWKELLSKKNRSSLYAYMADGAEGMIGLVVWPVFMFQILEGNYLEVGYLSALIIVVTMVLQFILGDKLDKGGDGEKKKFLKFGTLLYSLGWIVKIFVLTAFHIFIVGVYHNVVRIFARTSFDTMFFDIVASKKHYVDEFTVLHEMAVHLGKVIAMIFIIIGASFLSLQWTFLLGAGASMVMNLLRKDYKRN
ncbi:MFS transporter [Patescibacteria group bacterium]|nr:MFS transporter [Patescibacteria group bacterium]